MKKYFGMMVSFALTLLAFVTGASANVIMATAVEGVSAENAGNYDAGSSEAKTTASAINSSSETGADEGIATETTGRAYADDDFYLNDVDKRIVKIRPFSTPIDQISRYAKTEQVDSFICKYYSSGTRPVKTTLTSGVAGTTVTTSVKLQVTDPAMFTIDDTILVPSVSAVTKPNGGQYSNTDTNVPYLELCVCGRDSSSNDPIVFAVNGIPTGSTYASSTWTYGTGEPIGVPTIANGATIIRMGKAAGELDVQTGRFATRPTAETNYCQNFMIQIEQSTFDRIAAKEVNWDFSDLEEDGIYDMRLAQEFSYLFGDKSCIHHVTKDGMAQWFAKGIWYQAYNDLTIGTYDATSSSASISEADLVDFSKSVFSQVDAGNRRVLLAGSDLMAALDKINTDKIVQKDFITKWHLDFTELSTTFGKIDVLHCQLFDQLNMGGSGFLMDPDYLSKKVHVSWGRNVLDLKKAGVRNTDAVVIQEVACLCLRNAKAHARVALPTS